jgi:hypothetical protein
MTLSHGEMFRRVYQQTGWDSMLLRDTPPPIFARKILVSEELEKLGWQNIGWRGFDTFE